MAPLAVRAAEAIVRNILVPVDFSEVTRAVLDHAAAIARAFGSELRVVHVAAPDPAFVGYEVGPQVVRDQVAAELRDEHRKLQDIADALRERGVEAKALLLRGPTVAAILKEAETVAADCIVLGSHGHGALYRVLLGSVSEGVLRRATCPVLVVPAR